MFTTDRFTECFRVVARRKVGGGSKMTPADQTDWFGSFDGLMISLRTTPRLIEASAAFLLPSNARLSTSLPRYAESHFIDVEVRSGELDDDQMARLAELASLEDDRPILVRRRGDPTRTGFFARGGHR